MGFCGISGLRSVRSRLADLRSMYRGGSCGRERVVEGLDRFSPCQGMENEAGSLAPVLDLDAEFVLEVAAVPKQVDDDSLGVAVSEVICRGQHFPPPDSRDERLDARTWIRSCS